MVYYSHIVKLSSDINAYLLQYISRFHLAEGGNKTVMMQRKGKLSNATNYILLFNYI